MKIMNKPEFNIGDIVHFRAWKYHPQEGIRAKVKGIKHGSGDGGKSLINGEPDGRYFYRLTGDIESETTGLSIIESRHFKEPTE